MLRRRECVLNPDRVEAIVNMLARKGSARAIGHIDDEERPPVYLLDGKAYVVHKLSIDVWDYHEMMAAERQGEIKIVTY